MSGYTASHSHGINGIAWVADYGVGHAYNMTILPPANIQVVEPQTGETHSLPQATRKGYLACPCTIAL